MKEQIKELRVKLDGLAQLTKEIVPQAYVVGHGSDKVVGFESKELTRCYDSLILAKAWLGKILGELGESVWVTNLDNYKADYVNPITLPCEMSVIKHTPDMLWVIHKPSGKRFEIYHYQYSKTPYANDGRRKTVEDIEPTADVAKKLFPTVPNEAFDVNALNHIEKVDWLRQEIEKLINIVKQISLVQQPDIPFSREFSIARTNSYNYLCEARFWLGFELQRIKENGL
jgi:hypothetical protein